MELALILPIVVVTIAGLSEFSWIFWNFVALNNACHEGARIGIVQKQNEADNNAVIEQTKKSMFGLTVSAVEIEVRSQNGTVYSSDTRNGAEGYLLQVSGTCKYEFLTPLANLVPGIRSFKEIRGKAVLMCEQ